MRSRLLAARPNRVGRLALGLGLTALMLGAFPSIGLSQTALARAVLVSSERDPGVTALRQQVARKTVDIQAARDERYPQFSLSGDTSTTDANGAGITLTVSQVLFDWGLIESKIASASQERVKSVSELKMAIEQLTLDVSYYYLDIEVLDRKLARTRDYLDFANRIAGHADARAQGGVGDTGEVARAQLEIVRAEDRLSQLSGDRSLAVAQLQFLMGESPGRTSNAPELGFARRYGNAAEIAAAVRMSPDYLAARAGVAGAEAGVQTARASRLPTIKLQAQGRADLDGGRSRSAVGLTAGVDLNSGAFRGRQIQAAQLELEAATSSMNAVERNLTNAARTALERLRVLRASEASQQQQLIESVKVLDTYEEQFVGGQKELIDLLTTGRDLYDAQIAEIDTYDSRKRTEYDAAHALGVLGTLILATSTSG
ncbi:TolC family protein [Paracoccus caeni]|uniref:TolC family protein n=1 Tax=Paracoccus caeni TaxID=657651 RepID=A0A934W060_9RHOB|nr:TolC family protein [Paracoccus caeni]MBK4215988.1 TolC family protein [Paracoccus caeni]